MGAIWCAVGTSTTAPAYTDTQLGAEYARATMTTNSRTGNVVTLNFLFTSAQAHTQLNECGVFLNATSAVNSGTLINHAVINELKSSTVTMLVAVQLTLT